LVRVVIGEVRELRVDDGTRVTAASGVAPLGDGWLVAQDDATFAAWMHDGSVEPLPVLPRVDADDPAVPPAVIDLRTLLA
jgi:hypothetical protein